MQDKFLNLGLLWIRLLMGSGIAYHGYQKIFQGRMESFIGVVEKLGFAMPELFAWLAALSEFGGGILIVLGIGTRYAAFMIFGTMFVAAFIQHGDDPFSKKELALAYWTMAGALILTGGGIHRIWGKVKDIIMFGIGLPELIVIFLVVVLLFGTKALPEIAKSLGEAIRIFKRETKQINDDISNIKEEETKTKSKTD